MKRRIAVLLLVCVAGAARVSAQNGAGGAGEASCRQFTQAFYNWYVQKVAESDHGVKADPLLEALEYKGHPFASELAGKIRAVTAKQKKLYKVLLDFDPILNTNVPAKQYVVRRVTQKNGHYRAEIYALGDAAHPQPYDGPQVIVEMSYSQGRWVFVNFHYPGSPYPESENLLSILNWALR